MSRGYHVTTLKKLERYKATGAILPPVRWWSTEYSARRWARKTGRTVVLAIELPVRSWPLPVQGGAYWSDQAVRRWNAIPLKREEPVDERRQGLLQGL